MRRGGIAANCVVSEVGAGVGGAGSLGGLRPPLRPPRSTVALYEIHVNQLECSCTAACSNSFAQMIMVKNK
jgi:hypothetical protein